MPTCISLIVAVSQNGVIGNRGQLPWQLSADLRRFKQLTMGHTLVMGRLTYESIGRPLPGRVSIVVSRNSESAWDGCLVAPSWKQAIEMAPPDRELFAIGGRQIFEAALPDTQRLYWTAVHADVEGDVFFPALDWSEWKLVREESHSADERNEHAYSFRDYVRR